MIFRGSTSRQATSPQARQIIAQAALKDLLFAAAQRPGGRIRSPSAAFRCAD